MKKIFLIFLLALGMTYSHASEDAVTFTLNNTEGKKITVSELDDGLKFKEFQNRAVFLVLFGHMCPPCNAEIPEFIELTKEFPEKLAIVAIEAQRYTNEDLKKFREKKGINYNLVAGKDHDDFIGYIAHRAQWNGSIPLLIAIDKTGIVQAIQPGFIPKETLVKLIDTLNQ